MNICLMGNTLRPVKRDQLITGYSVAVRDLTKRLLRYSTAKQIYCIQSPWQTHSAMMREIINAENLIPEKVHIIDEMDCLFHGSSSMPEIDILHSVKEDPISLLSLRESIGKPIPLRKH